MNRIRYMLIVFREAIISSTVNILFTAVVAAAMVFSSALATHADSLGSLIVFEVPPSVSIEWITGGADMTVPITPEDVVAGEKWFSGGSYVVNSGMPYYLSVSATGTYTQGGSQPLPGEIMVEFDNSGVYTSLLNIGELTIFNPLPDSGYVHTLEYMIKLAPDYTPGAYSTTLIYTVRPAL